MASSNRWLDRHRRDPYVRQAHVDMYRSRAAYKLIGLQNKYSLFKAGDYVMDLGAAPGSWSQVALEYVVSDDKQGKVISLDINYFPPIDGCVTLPNCDVTNLQSTSKQLKSLPFDLDGNIDVIVSDMAPNVSGQKALDHGRSVRLCLAALRLSTQLPLLKKGGFFVCKLLSGPDNSQLKMIMLKFFDKVIMHKPPASRKDSSETFMIASNFLGS